VDFEREWARLQGAVAVTVGLLESCGEMEWAGILVGRLARVDAYGGNGLDSVLSLFGGMGSFNDLVLHPLNGHLVEPDALAEVNERLEFLREEILESATALRAGLVE
jgi:hypothetical protein